MHPRRFTLERFFANDLRPEERAETQAHVAACDVCRDAVRDMEADRSALLATRSPAAFVARVKAAAPRARSWRTGWPLLVATAAVGATAVFAVMVKPQAGSDVIHMKGGSASVHRIRGAEVELLGSGVSVRPDDALRLTVHLDEAAAVQAWFLDTDGRLDELLPSPVLLGSGEHVLPGAAIVDTPCRDMRLAIAFARSMEALPAGNEIKERLVQGDTGDLFVTRIHCQ